MTVDPQLILGSPEDGFYDALALIAGIAPGGSVDGFSVSFDWLGSGKPGPQLFEIVDPVTFGVLDSGRTSSVYGKCRFRSECNNRKIGAP